MLATNIVIQSQPTKKDCYIFLEIRDNIVQPISIFTYPDR